MGCSPEWSGSSQMGDLDMRQTRIEGRQWEETQASSCGWAQERSRNSLSHTAFRRNRLCRLPVPRFWDPEQWDDTFLSKPFTSCSFVLAALGTLTQHFLVHVLSEEIFFLIKREACEKRLIFPSCCLARDAGSLRAPRSGGQAPTALGFSADGSEERIAWEFFMYSGYKFFIRSVILQICIPTHVFSCYFS